MLTKIFTSPKQEPSQNTLHFPKRVEADIQDRGFHLYKWISPEEVKLSIERDFLRVIKIVGVPLAVISILLGLMSPVIFIVSVFFGVFLMFLYLGFLSLKRSALLSKSAFVVLTDSSISLGGKIHKYSEISELRPEIDKVGGTFEEDLFGESGLSSSKSRLGKEVMDQLFGGYQKIFSGTSRYSRGFGNNSDDARLVLVLVGLYTLYVGIMASVYFVGVLFLLVFGKIITWINTKFLIWKGDTVLKINELFGKLDTASEDIQEEKKSLTHFLSEAQKNEWKDGLLLEINSGIKNVNELAQQAVVGVLELRNTITKSRYEEMFSFEVYNGWIKKQIAHPLEQIQTLLENNLLLLKSTRDDIETQIKETPSIEHMSNLKLALQRVELQIRDTTQFLPILQESLQKLEHKS
ncbi:hypothetical protein N9J72_00880 [Candidatus Gracilibacteria bacterium]|nr:hypothetical protein [Candidatus Gracilibacteria bacterium]